MGIEPTNVGATIRCVNHFAIAAISKWYDMTKIMVAQDGIEPPTQGFSVLCSTD